MVLLSKENKFVKDAVNGDNAGKKAPMKEVYKFNQALSEVGHVLQHGANKYSWDNWEKCEDLNNYRNALARHVGAYCAGEYDDSDSGYSHLSHIITNALFLLSLEQKESA